jgi:hypothetical protein
MATAGNQAGLMIVRAVTKFHWRTSKARSGWRIFWRRGARVALEIGTKADDRYLKSTPVRSNGASFEEMNQVELAPPARSVARKILLRI